MNAREYTRTATGGRRCVKTVKNSFECQKQNEKIPFLRIINVSAKQAFLLEVERFAQGLIDLETLKAAIDLMLPGDAINAFLAEIQ